MPYGVTYGTSEKAQAEAIADSIGSIISATAVIPNDSTTFAATRAIWIGGAGNLSVVFTRDSSPVTISGVAAGTLLPFAVVKVLSTGTTATNIVRLY